MIDINHKDIEESNAIEIDGIEFVKVVRCKDCGAFRKFATKKYEWETDGFCNQTNWCMRDDDYCSDGERKEE